MSCSVCCENFDVLDCGRLQKFTLSAISTSPYTTKKIFPGISHSAAVVCGSCAKHLRSQTTGLKANRNKRRWSGLRTPGKSTKRRDVKNTPQKSTQSDPHDAPAHTINVSTSCFFKSSAIRQIIESHYKEAFKGLISSSPAAKTALLEVHNELLQSEWKNVSSGGVEIASMCGDVTVPRMRAFSWEQTLMESEATLPITTAFLTQVFPSPCDMRQEVTKGSKSNKR